MDSTEGLASTPEALDNVEWTRFATFMFMQFNAWEFYYYQNRDNQIPRELWIGADAYYRELIKARPGAARVWDEFRIGYAEPFRRYPSQGFAKQPDPVVATA